MSLGKYLDDNNNKTKTAVVGSGRYSRFYLAAKASIVNHVNAHLCVCVYAMRIGQAALSILTEHAFKFVLSRFTGLLGHIEISQSISYLVLIKNSN